MTPAKHMKALNRRADHLKTRVAANPKLSYDRAELAALKWAMDELKDRVTRGS